MCLIALFLFVTAPNPITCRACIQDDPFGDDVAMCNKNQAILPCSYGEFPNVGTTHCFTAAGRYWNNENQRVSTGILRGCINCTGNKSLISAIKVMHY